jgi:hypothetical protein
MANAERVKVTGVKAFKGTIEGSGDEIDSGSIFVEEKLDDSRGNAKGFCSGVYGLGSAEAGRRIMHNDFPLMCDVTFERRTNGKQIRVIVTDVKPVEAVAPAGRAQQPARAQ